MPRAGGASSNHRLEWWLLDRPPSRAMTGEPRLRQEVSKSQYRLRDDVLLDLVRAAVDRDLAPVEVLRRERRGVVRADRRLVPAVLVGVAELIRQRVGADRLQQQFRDALLDLRALDLED